MDNIADLLKTIELGPVKTKKVPGETNLYEIEGSPGKRSTSNCKAAMRMSRTTSKPSTANLPDPGPLTKGLTTRYDLAVSINMDGIPKGMRTMFMDLLRRRNGGQTPAARR